MFVTLAGQLTETQGTCIDRLWRTNGQASVVAQLAIPSRAPSTRAVVDDCERLELIRAVLPPAIDWGSITANRWRQWAAVVRRLTAQALRRYPPAKRRTLLLAFLVVRGEEINQYCCGRCACCGAPTTNHTAIILALRCPSNYRSLDGSLSLASPPACRGISALASRSSAAVPGGAVRFQSALITNGITSMRRDTRDYALGSIAPSWPRGDRVPRVDRRQREWPASSICHTSCCDV